MGLRSGEQETGPRDGGNVVAVTVGRRLGDRKGKGEGGSSPSSLVSPLLASSLFRREPPSRGCAIAKRRIREQAILTGVRVPGPPSTGCIVSTRIWEVVFVWSPFTSWAQSAEEVSLGDAAQRGISAGVFFSLSRSDGQQTSHCAGTGRSRRFCPARHALKMHLVQAANAGYGTFQYTVQPRYRYAKEQIAVSAVKSLRQPLSRFRTNSVAIRARAPNSRASPQRSSSDCRSLRTTTRRRVATSGGVAWNM